MDNFFKSEEFFFLRILILFEKRFIRNRFLNKNSKNHSLVYPRQKNFSAQLQNP